MAKKYVEAEALVSHCGISCLERTTMAIGKVLDARHHVLGSFRERVLVCKLSSSDDARQFLNALVHLTVIIEQTIDTTESAFDHSGVLNEPTASKPSQFGLNRTMASLRPLFRGLPLTRQGTGQASVEEKTVWYRNLAD